MRTIVDPKTEKSLPDSWSQSIYILLPVVECKLSVEVAHFRGKIKKIYLSFIMCFSFTTFQPKKWENVVGK